MNAYMDAAGGRDDFEVMSGSMSTVFTCMDRGGKGGVVSASNYFPEQCAEVVRLYREGGPRKAWAYYTVLQDVIKKTGARGSVAGVKCCMNLMGLKGGLPRKPVLPDLGGNRGRNEAGAFGSGLYLISRPEKFRSKDKGEQTHEYFGSAEPEAASRAA